MRDRWAQMNLPRSSLMESSCPVSYCRRMSSSSDTMHTSAALRPLFPPGSGYLYCTSGTGSFLPLLESHQFREIGLPGDDGFDRRLGAREQHVDARPVAALAAGAVHHDGDGRRPLLPARAVRAVVVRDRDQIPQAQLVERE